MERSTNKNGFINLFALLVIGTAAFAVARFSNSFSGQVSVTFLGLGLLVAAVSWFQTRLENKERVERLELDELAKGHGSSALFESKDAELFPAQRAREQFERFFLPIFTVIMCLLQAGGAYLIWTWLRTTGVQPIKQPTTAMALFGLFALVLF